MDTDGQVRRERDKCKGEKDELKGRVRDRSQQIDERKDWEI